MGEPENHTLHVLREISSGLSKLSDRVDRNYREHQKRIDSLREALYGESVLGRYTIAAFDTRVSALEKRVSRLQKPK
jgi:hypothetical protein